MQRPVDTVIGFLEAELAGGITHVLLDEESREALRDLNRKAREGCIATAAVPSAAPASPAVEWPAPESAAQPSVVPVATRVVVRGSSKQEQLDSLRIQAENWQAAKNLGTLRDTMVFAVGNPDAKIMLVGEAPGYEEERRREPFVGPAGQKLDDILRAMGLSRSDVYISNIVKFRPTTLRQTTNNRKPDATEIACCLPFVQAEVEIVRPSCIIALGSTAAEGLLGKSTAVTDLRRDWHEFQGVPVRVTYHPSYLLRSQSDLGVKRALWEDMLAVMDRLEMSVSAKQRGYFLPKA